MAVRLYHNDRRILWNDVAMDGTWKHISNALALELQEGDEVYMTLSEGDGIYDDTNKQTSFSGFLIFPM